MEGLDLLHVPHWQPLQQFGYTHPFFNINSLTVFNTFIVMGLITCMCIVMRICLSHKKSVLRFLSISYITLFFDLIEQTLGFFSYNYFCFMTALFTFIAICNMISILPGVEEPTQDINTTLALGCVAFLYTQIMVIKQQGLWHTYENIFSHFLLCSL